MKKLFLISVLLLVGSFAFANPADNFSSQNDSETKIKEFESSVLLNIVKDANDSVTYCVVGGEELFCCEAEPLVKPDHVLEIWLVMRNSRKKNLR